MWFLQSGLTLEQTLMTIVALLITIFIVLPIHEWAHGFVAYKFGDNTAKINGRLTLNPLKHIDPLGAMAMILFKFGWAKPVPVDARNFKNPRLGMALTALAGPMSNLIVALLFAFVFRSLFQFINLLSINAIVYITTFIITIIRINIGLAVFNLIPAPPLDGSKILGAFLPDKYLQKYYQYEGYIISAIFLLMITNVFSIPLSFFQNIIFNGIMWLVGFN